MDEPSNSSNNQEDINQNNENYDENDYNNENESHQNEENESESRIENESLYSYDENKDFPVFANKINKKLNDIILHYKQELKSLVKEIEEDREMVKILKEHKASVENQVKNRERMVDEMTS